MENKRGEAWTHEETVLLIELWDDQRVQEQLENMPKRNLEIFKRICQDIKDHLARLFEIGTRLPSSN
jgi:hypothetical protein